MRSDLFNWELMRFRLEKSEVQMGDEFWENPLQLRFNKASGCSEHSWAYSRAGGRWGLEILMFP